MAKGWRVAKLWLTVAVASLLIGQGCSVPGAPAGSLEVQAAPNTTWGEGYSLTEVDEQATATIHYAAGALSNHSKKTLDDFLPKVKVAAKHYGW
jgi:hypothetical protein